MKFKYWLKMGAALSDLCIAIIVIPVSIMLLVYGFQKDGFDRVLPIAIALLLVKGK